MKATEADKTQKKRKIEDCKFFKPRGKKTHYCSVDEKDPLKQCYGVCKLFCTHNKPTL